jgi:hypothetical protein
MNPYSKQFLMKKNETHSQQNSKLWIRGSQLQMRTFTANTCVSLYYLFL